MTFFQATPQEHFPWTKHLTAEVKTEEFVAGRGVITKWECKRRQNHWLDALYNACAAGHYCGVRLVQEEVKEKPPPPAKKEQPRVEGRRYPWIDTERWKETQARIWGRR